MKISIIYDDDVDVDDGHVRDLNLEVDHEGLPHVDVSRVRVGFVWYNLCPAWLICNVDNANNDDLTIVTMMMDAWFIEERILLFLFPSTKPWR